MAINVRKNSRSCWSPPISSTADNITRSSISETAQDLIAQSTQNKRKEGSEKTYPDADEIFVGLKDDLAILDSASELFRLSHSLNSESDRPLTPIDPESLDLSWLISAEMSATPLKDQSLASPHQISKSPESNSSPWLESQCPIKVDEKFSAPTQSSETTSISLSSSSTSEEKVPEVEMLSLSPTTTLTSSALSQNDSKPSEKSLISSPIKSSSLESICQQILPHVEMLSADTQSSSIPITSDSSETTSIVKLPARTSPVPTTTSQEVSPSNQVSLNTTTSTSCETALPILASLTSSSSPTLPITQIPAQTNQTLPIANSEDVSISSTQKSSNSKENLSGVPPKDHESSVPKEMFEYSRSLVDSSSANLSPQHTSSPTFLEKRRREEKDSWHPRRSFENYFNGSSSRKKRLTTESYAGAPRSSQRDENQPLPASSSSSSSHQTFSKPTSVPSWYSRPSQSVSQFTEAPIPVPISIASNMSSSLRIQPTHTQIPTSIPPLSQFNSQLPTVYPVQSLNPLYSPSVKQSTYTRMPPIPNFTSSPYHPSTGQPPQMPAPIPIVPLPAAVSHFPPSYRFEHHYGTPLPSSDTNAFNAQLLEFNQKILNSYNRCMSDLDESLKKNRLLEQRITKLSDELRNALQKK